MSNWIAERERKYREFFEFSDETEIIPANASQFELTAQQDAGLRHFNIEWHFIPSCELLPFDEAYVRKMYPTAHRLNHKASAHEKSVRNHLCAGHCRQQGYVVGIETTQKPKYLPRNRQYYGTSFGHDPSADPLAEYFGRAGMTSGTRFDQNYRALRHLFDILNEDWRRRNILPDGYRVTVCPPAIFNLVGTVFHPEWSHTESLELGFYRDERGNASCFAVGANAPGDFSYIDVVEGEEWTLTGYRLALLPEQTKYDAKCSE